MRDKLLSKVDEIHIQEIQFRLCYSLSKLFTITTSLGMVLVHSNTLLPVGEFSSSCNEDSLLSCHRMQIVPSMCKIITTKSDNFELLLNSLLHFTLITVINFLRVTNIEGSERSREN